jgi:hypothetical protein
MTDCLYLRLKNWQVVDVIMKQNMFLWHLTKTCAAQNDKDILHKMNQCKIRYIGRHIRLLSECAVCHVCYVTVTMIKSKTHTNKAGDRWHIALNNQGHYSGRESWRSCYIGHSCFMFDIMRALIRAHGCGTRTRHYGSRLIGHNLNS